MVVPVVDDTELIERVVRGDRGGLVALYERHGGVTLAQVELLVGDRGLGEEIVQDTMLAVWHGAAAFRGESRVRTWIVSIALRKARDRLRRRRHEVVDDSVLAQRPSVGPGPEDVVLVRAEAAVVAAAVRSLGLIHREVLGLVFGCELTLRETAAVLEIPVGTVKSRLSAARAALVRALHEEAR